MHYEKFGDSSKGPSVDDIFSEKEGRGHEIGKMSVRRLWMAPIYIHLYYFLLYSKYQWIETTIVGQTSLSGVVPWLYASSVRNNYLNFLS